MSDREKIQDLLDFPSRDILFQKMLIEYPELLLNIDLLFKNKLNLARSYHDPKNFIVQCNNILSNLFFFVEFAKKQQSKQQCRWLYNSISELMEAESETYNMLKTLRNTAVHNKLIVPEGAFSVGLFKILNKAQYRLKIGLGDDKVKNNVADRYLYKKTADVFHNLLTFHFVFFIDINHSAIGECLGITRKWYYDITYKYKGRKIRKTVDIYKAINDFCDNVVNAAFHSFGQIEGLKYTSQPVLDNSSPNFVNTLLEIDLYPTLFDKWWQGNHKPLNYDSLLSNLPKQETDKRYGEYERIYDDLPNGIEDYLKRIRRYETVRIQDFTEQEDYNSYARFISLNHWYLNRIVTKDFL